MGKKQSNHLVEGSVNIVKGLLKTLKSSTETNLRTEIGPSHPPILWISLSTPHIVGRRQNSDGEAERQRSSASNV